MPRSRWTSRIKVTKVALDTPKNNRSRLQVGTTLTRGELMHLALMSSENRAAYLNRCGLPWWLAGVGRGDEPQGARTGHERLAFRRAHRLVERQPLQRAGSRVAGQGGLSASAAARVLDGRRRVGGGGPSHGPVPQHQLAGAQPLVGDRPAEDRLHLRGWPLPGDAGAARRAQAHHGAARFDRPLFARRRRRAHPSLARHDAGGAVASPQR